MTIKHWNCLEGIQKIVFVGSLLGLAAPLKPLKLLGGIQKIVFVGSLPGWAAPLKPLKLLGRHSENCVRGVPSRLGRAPETIEIAWRAFRKLRSWGLFRAGPRL